MGQVGQIVRQLQVTLYADAIEELDTVYKRIEDDTTNSKINGKQKSRFVHTTSRKK